METSIMNEIQGTWILSSMNFNDTEGNEIEMYGPDPLGIVTFDSSGFMNAQMGSQNRAFFESDAVNLGTPDEINSAFNSYMAFFGQYSEQSPGVLLIKLHGCLFPNWQGKEMIRYATIENDKLFLTTPPTRLGANNTVVQAVWSKV